MPSVFVHLFKSYLNLKIEVESELKKKTFKIEKLQEYVLWITENANKDFLANYWNE